MLKTNFKKFLFEKLTDKNLLYYCFDWDDNILVMPSIIHVDHLINGEWTPVDLTTAEFAEIRTEIARHTKGEQTEWKLRNDSYSDTYCEFRDYGKRGKTAFVDDTIKAIRTNSFGPVWDKFIQCMINGHVFMIITARGHEPDTIRLTINWIIWNFLTSEQRTKMDKNIREFNKLFDYDDSRLNTKEVIDHYLDLCDFVGIYSSYFTKKYNTEGQAANPEKYKSMAIKSFIEKIDEFGKRVNRKVSVGFSDDDPLTAKYIHKYMKDELSLDFPIDYHVYLTKDGVTKLE
jgi:hypothetical protein